jgi:hypothetical protein
VLTSNEEVLLIDIPPETGETLREIAQGETLLGRILTFQRETKNIRSRLIVTDVGQYKGLKKLPLEIDPTPTLMKMWGLI